MSRIVASIAMLPLALTACSTIRYPEVVPPRVELPATRPVVGIVEPLAHLDAIQPPESHRRLLTHESERDLKASAHLIQLLRGTGLFEEVDFVCQLGSEPNVGLFAIPQLWSRNERDTSTLTFWLWLLTIGIVPWVETRDLGVRFAAVARSGPEVVLVHEETSVVGWVAPFMNLSPEWHTRRNPEARSVALSAILQQLEPSIFDPAEWLSRVDVDRLTRRCDSSAHVVFQEGPGRQDVEDTRRR